MAGLNWIIANIHWYESSRQIRADAAICRPFQTPGGVPSHEQAHQDRSGTDCDGKSGAQGPFRRGRGLSIAVVRDGASWAFRTNADDATVAKPGYPESVAMLVQIGDHLSKQYD